MDQIDGEAVVEVAAGVLVDQARRALLIQRLPGKHLAGKWEFPGGKIEPGETVRDALDRELDEELGITVLDAATLITVVWRYPEKSVRLHVLRVTGWRGDPVPREGNPMRWVPVAEMDPAVMPAADVSIIAALRAATPS